MALDLSRVSKNQKFWTSFTRITRFETVNEYGESVLTKRSHKMMGTITLASPNDLFRFTDATTYVKAINIMTEKPLNTASVGAQPDIIVWLNEHFIVKGTYPYSENGFNRAIAVLSDYQASIGG